MKLDPHAWLQRFALPLVAGGDVRVAGALGRREVESLLAWDWQGDEVAERFGAARQAVAAEITIDPSVPPLDEETLRLAAAMQNLLFLLHPASQALSVRRATLERLARFTVELAALPPAPEAARLVARHSLLHHLFDLGRDDVRVTFWAGKREFKGAEPPARLLRWAGVRRVHEERWRTGIATEASADPELRKLIDALLAASPLTDLWEPLRLEPALDLDRSARWLRDARIARAVADRWLACGLLQVAAPLSSALLRLYQRKHEAAGLVTQFACHLHLLDLLAAPRRSIEERVAEIKGQVQAQATARDFFGLFAAAQPLGLGRPHDLGAAPAVDAYVTACRTVCGGARVAELAGLIAAGVGSALPLAASA